MSIEEQYLIENYPPEVVEDIEFSNSIKQAYLDGIKSCAKKFIPVKIGSSTLHVNADKVTAFMTPKIEKCNGEIDILIANHWYHVKKGKEFLKELNVYEVV